MDQQRYQEVINYHQSKEIPERINSKNEWENWAKEFEERNNHLY